MTDPIQPGIIDDWMRALRHAESALDHLRYIYPSRMLLLEESGHRAIGQAMREIENGLGQLHRAGRYVMGQEAYEQFVLERDEERVRGAPPRGDRDG